MTCTEGMLRSSPLCDTTTTNLVSLGENVFGKREPYTRARACDEPNSSSHNLELCRMQDVRRRDSRPTLSNYNRSSLIFLPRRALVDRDDSFNFFSKQGSISTQAVDPHCESTRKFLTHLDPSAKTQNLSLGRCMTKLEPSVCLRSGGLTRSYLPPRRITNAEGSRTSILRGHKRVR